MRINIQQIKRAEHTNLYFLSNDNLIEKQALW